ncbi:MAG: hypothetical protein EP344_00175 [Bacteroidetes bacterium]|nr:MAG: hypothetical protein EP344_00175 [Bacteroidota bacterium]
MGTQSSELSFITRQPLHTTNVASSKTDRQPISYTRADVSDGGGTGFMVVLLVLVLGVIAWWVF